MRRISRRVCRRARAGALGALLATAACAPDAAPPALVLGATHTLEDSGLLDSLAVGFRNDHPQRRLRVVVAASAEVLEMAARRDVDVVISHAPALEQALIASGRLTHRHPLMENYFLIAGPLADPARVRDVDAVTAFARIARAGSPFVSRDDRSGTHQRELELWAAAAVDTTRLDGRLRAGVGMADALRIADERDAYILSDPATFALLQQTLRLTPLVTGEERSLRNVYSVLRPRVEGAAADAEALYRWLTGPHARAIIASFGPRDDARPLYAPIESMENDEGAAAAEAATTP